MPTPIRFEPEAERELEEAAATYEERRLRLGKRFLEAVTVTLDRVQEFPLAGAPVRHVPTDLGVRQAPIRGFPYRVVYLHTDTTIHVLAIAHYRRRPGYWRDR